MWIIIQWMVPNHTLQFWYFIVAILGWVTFLTLGSAPWFTRQIPGMFLWTDILNMVAVGLFNDLPTFWWAHGWTISMLPIIGRFWITLAVWLVTLLIFGPTLIGVGFKF